MTEPELSDTQKAAQENLAKKTDEYAKRLFLGIKLSGGQIDGAMLALQINLLIHQMDVLATMLAEAEPAFKEQFWTRLSAALEKNTAAMSQKVIIASQTPKQ